MRVHRSKSKCHIFKRGSPRTYILCCSPEYCLRTGILCHSVLVKWNSCDQGPFYLCISFHHQQSSDIRKSFSKPELESRVWLHLFSFPLDMPSPRRKPSLRQQGVPSLADSVFRGSTWRSVINVEPWGWKEEEGVDLYSWQMGNSICVGEDFFGRVQKSDVPISCN